jgi:hypothetical protein
MGWETGLCDRIRWVIGGHKGARARRGVLKIEDYESGSHVERSRKLGRRKGCAAGVAERRQIMCRVIYDLVATMLYWKMSTRQLHGWYARCCTIPRAILLSSMLYYIVSSSVFDVWKVQDVGALLLLIAICSGWLWRVMLWKLLIH